VRWLGIGLLALTAGCGSEAVATAPPSTPAPAAAVPAAAAAGGACALLDYAVIEKTLGIRFDVAAASQHKQTSTCVLQAQDATRPDLTLSTTKTSADSEIFNDEVKPDGAQTVKGLGTAAYQQTTKAHIEFGWLTKDKRLITLRYTQAPGQPNPAATKLLALAKTIGTQ
jgi:hypothetical protein